MKFDLGDVIQTELAFKPRRVAFISPSARWGGGGGNEKITRKQRMFSRHVHLILTRRDEEARSRAQPFTGLSKNSLVNYRFRVRVRVHVPIRPTVPSLLRFFFFSHAISAGVDARASRGITSVGLSV